MTLTFKKQAAQGDMLITKISELPDMSDLTEEKPQGKNVVLAHSETGHHHVIEATPDVKYYKSKTNPLLAYLEVTETESVTFEHVKDYDTHEAFKPMEPGFYEITRQREFVPGGWRKAMD